LSRISEKEEPTAKQLGLVNKLSSIFGWLWFKRPEHVNEFCKITG
jgi:hypothetical protein